MERISGGGDGVKRLPRAMGRWEEEYPGEKSLATLRSSVNLTAGSKRLYVTAVRDISRTVGLTPDRLLATLKAHPEKLPELYGEWLRKSPNLSYKTVGTRTAGLRLWLNQNEHWSDETDSPPYWKAALRKAKQLRNGKAKVKPAVAVESRDLTLNDLREIFAAADERGKAFISTLYSSGARIGACIALKFRDFIDPLEQEKDSYAVKLKVKGGTASGRKTYVWFISREARDHILTHRKQREKWGEVVTADSPVIVAYDASRKPKKKGTHFTRNGAESYFRRLFRRIQQVHEIGQDKLGRKIHRCDVHCHLLRKLHRSALDTAGVRDIVAEVGLGHTISESDMRGIYDLNLGMTESLRLSYRRALPHLTLLANLPKLATQAEEMEKMRRRLDELEGLFATIRGKGGFVRRKDGKIIDLATGKPVEPA